MAQLSEADKKLLLGENYRAAEQADEQANARTFPQRLTETLRANCEQVRSSALVIAGIAAIIAITNYLQVSGPYQRTLEMAAVTVVAAGIVFASFAHIVMSRHS
jgi:hypothetical protein